MFSEEEKARLAVGYKQTMKAVKNKSVRKVYIADDCEDKIKNSIEESVKDLDAEVYHIDSMRDLGKLCGISTSASCAVILK